MSKWMLGIDVGGTFTDVVLVDAAGVGSVLKIPSTPPTFADAVVEGARRIRNDSGGAPHEPGEYLAHASTVATNAILERKGARVGLITTKGFRDVLELRRMRMPDPFDSAWRKPSPLVPRELRVEVDERLASDGTVVKDLDPADALGQIAFLAGRGVDSIAVCLLHSYRNSSAERAVADLIRLHYPDIDVSLSSDVLPERREYERMSTTVINAYVRPVTGTYLASIQAGTRAHAINAPILMMQSNGGMTPLRDAQHFPAYVVESGPAGGVVAAANLARQYHVDSLITLDMGGTTAKGSMVIDGRPLYTEQFEVGAPISFGQRLLGGGGYSLRFTSVDLAECGIGGGSIVWLDEANGIHIGPQSAGANPGPACYGKGGVSPTVTDVDLILGYLVPGPLASGDIELRPELAVAAVRPLADRLGLSPQQFAAASYQIAGTTIGSLLRSISLERGRDIRGGALVAYGGAGPMHGCDVATTMGLRTVFVPPSAGVFSTLGLLQGRVEVQQVQTVQVRLADVTAELLRTTFAALEKDATSRLSSWETGSQRLLTERYAEVRYKGQEHSVRVRINDFEVSTDAMAAEFANEYERQYGYVNATAALEVTSLRLTCGYELEGADLEHTSWVPQLTRELPASQIAIFDGVGTRTPILTRSQLRGPVSGPLLVVDYDTTVVVPPRAVIERDPDNTLRISLTDGGTT